MRAATFEESEFEDALYNQLERGFHLLWSPGQVLEARVGFDRSLFVQSLQFWTWLGFRGPLAGAALNRYTWPDWWRPQGNGPALPSFRQDLFLQAKRSLYSAQPPRGTKALGFSGETWGFRVKRKQQRALDVLAKTTAGRALVAYAAPVFHTRERLFQHTLGRSMVKHSTFPPALRLSGHQSWYYQRAGAIGVANPRIEWVEELSLEDRIRQFASSAGTLEALDDELGFLDRALFSAVQASVTARPPSNLAFLNQRLLIERFAEGVALDSATYHFLLVIHAVETLRLSWLVVGGEKSGGNG
jgi:hypothetical protein